MELLKFANQWGYTNIAKQIQDYLNPLTGKGKVLGAQDQPQVSADQAFMQQVSYQETQKRFQDIVADSTDRIAGKHKKLTGAADEEGGKQA